MSLSTPLHRRQLFIFTALALGVLVAWDASSLDIALARLMGGETGFPLRDNWLLTRVLHDGAKRVTWALVTGVCLSVWWPIGPLRQLDLQGRLQLAVTALSAAFAVSALKSFSYSSCPWDLSLFGGVARYASHWSSLPDGGSGHCFPAGHASSGFAFLGGYFAFRRVAPGVARVWLFASLGAGLAFGAAQQLRGAHFMSHTLWTGFICWSVALFIDSAQNHFRSLRN